MRALVSISDSAVIESSLSRPDAFAAIFDRHFEAIHRYLARRAGSSAADDLAAQTFFVAFGRRRTFHTECDTALPWLYGIASMLLANHGRARRSALEAESRLRAETRAVQPEIPETTNGNAPYSSRLASALRLLSSDQLEVLLLYAWAELSYQEIAEALDVSLGTVRSRLARTRVQLQESLSTSAQHEEADHDRRA